MSEKRLWYVEAFEWVYGERIVRRKAYTKAYSERQAIFQAFRGVLLHDSWSVSAKAVST